jgi:hydrogenase maturation protein HypF
VGALRARKHREDKPFALMAGSPAAAGRLVALGVREQELLTDHARPIVLVPRLAGAAVADSVAPGARELGVMLPYSPLHHLLVADAGATLVMTSGNVSDEPIAYRDEDALERLVGLADLVLLHDRAIQTRTDDSVVRVVAAQGRPRDAFLRRSRGYVPASLPLTGGTGVALLACGAELKNTICVAKGERAWVSHHVGDLCPRCLDPRRRARGLVRGRVRQSPAAGVGGGRPARRGPAGPGARTPARERRGVAYGQAAVAAARLV